MSDFENEDIDYNKPMSLNVWKKMFPFIMPEKKNLIICMVLMLSAAFVDIVIPLLLGLAIRNNIMPRSTDGVWLLISVTAFLVIIQGLNVHFFVAIGIKAECAMDIGFGVFGGNHASMRRCCYIVPCCICGYINKILHIVHLPVGG